MLVVPDQGELVLIRRMLKPASGDSNPLRLQLYANDYTPHKESVLADFTQASFAGYAQVDLDPTGWSTAQSVAGVAQLTWLAGFISWLASSGSQTVYGYLVTDNLVNTVLWAERYPSPVTVTTTTPALVLPTMRLRSELQPDP